MTFRLWIQTDSRQLLVLPSEKKGRLLADYGQVTDVLSLRRLLQ